MEEQIPLHKQAELKILGDHQYIDKETIFWMKEKLNINEIKLDKSFLDKIDVNIIKGFFPKEDWFLKSTQVDSIHGIRHLCRVSIYSYLLIKKLNIKTNAKEILFASGMHDIGRINDKKDLGHGKRSFAYLNNKYNNLFKNVDSELVKILCEVHESEYSEIDKIYIKKYFKEINVLRTADALDRFRLPKEKWWLKKKFIKIDIDDDFIFFSKLLVFKSEYNFCILKKDQISSVLDALNEIINCTYEK